MEQYIYIDDEQIEAFTWSQWDKLTRLIGEKRTLSIGQLIDLLDRNGFGTKIFGYAIIKENGGYAVLNGIEYLWNKELIDALWEVFVKYVLDKDSQ